MSTQDDRNAAAWAMLRQIYDKAIRMLPMNLAVELDRLLKDQTDTSDVTIERTTQNSLEDRAIVELLEEWVRRVNLPNIEDLRERTKATLASWGQDSQRAG